MRVQARIPLRHGDFERSWNYHDRKQYALNEANSLSQAHLLEPGRLRVHGGAISSGARFSGS